MQSRGFTLVELLVALVLGLTLTGGIVSMYLQNRQNYLQDEEGARLQENARYALNLLKREVVMAGFIAGVTDYEDIPSASVTTDCVASGNWALDLSYPFDLIDDASTGSSLQPIFGDGSGTPITWSCISASEIVDGADIISIKRTADRYSFKDGNPITAGLTQDSNQIYLDSYENHADFTWKMPGAALGTTDYENWEYYSKIYFLRAYSRTGGDNIPTLCSAELVGQDMATRCLVEGIEDLQIEVGVDSDDDNVPDFFTDAPTTANIEDAVMVRVYLLVRSVNAIPNYTNTKNYVLGSKTIAAQNDGFIRRVFSTSVQMRNAKLPNA